MPLGCERRTLNVSCPHEGLPAGDPVKGARVRGHAQRITTWHPGDRRSCRTVCRSWRTVKQQRHWEQREPSRNSRGAWCTCLVLCCSLALVTHAVSRAPNGRCSHDLVPVAGSAPLLRTEFLLCAALSSKTRFKNQINVGEFYHGSLQAVVLTVRRAGGARTDPLLASPPGCSLAKWLYLPGCFIFCL